MITDLKVLQQQLVRIENIKTWLVDVPLLHPDTDKYAKLWSRYTQMCIEGLWGYDMGGWRYMPGTLFFYGNFFTILDFDDEQKVRRKIKPIIRDIDWMLHYAYLEAQGFSGWEDDDEYSSDYAIYDDHEFTRLKSSKKAEDKKRYLSLINSKGEVKKFLHPRENIKKLHPNKMGRPLYWNGAKNLMCFGSRGGGKSFSFAGISAHHLTFDGLKYFSEEEFNNPPTIQVCIGASDSNKSSELCQKVQDGLHEFGLDKNLGVWGTIYDDDYTPNPFYRDWTGTLNPPNKKNPFRYEYEAKIGNRWVKGQGTKSALIHVNYSDKKQGGEAAAAGGRYILVIYEEIGLQANFKEAVQSNKATVMGRAKQQGVQVGIGTSGNIELVQQSKMVFNSPSEYNFLEYEDIWENNGKIGFFLPCYITDVKFKDENGNTNLEEAVLHYAKQRDEAASKSDPDVLRFEKMNYPMIPSDMWTSNKGHYFPITELLHREKELIHKGLYKTIGTPTKFSWTSDPRYKYEVKHEFDENAEPFYDFPFDKSMSTLDGSPIIYQTPIEIEGEIPHDAYIFTLDPYVADNIDEGGSLGAFYGFLNPKYSLKGYNGSTIVCSYIGKHINGKDAFYENIEKIIAYYGNCPQSLWYEADQGDSVRGYFLRRRKVHLLAPTPNKERGQSAYEKKVITYGVRLGSLENKLILLGDAYDLLLSQVMFNGKMVRYYETLPDIFLIRQMQQFEIKKHKNFDAVSAFILVTLVFKELEHALISEIEKKTKHNPIGFLSVNPNMFHNDSSIHNSHKFKYQLKYENEHREQL